MSFFFLFIPQIKNSLPKIVYFVNHQQNLIGNDRLRLLQSCPALKEALRLQNLKLRTRIMLLNSLVRCRFLYRCHAWCATVLKMPKVSAICEYFLRSIITNGVNSMKPVGHKEAHPSSDVIDWCCRIPSKGLYQISEIPSLEDFQQQQP